VYGLQDADGRAGGGLEGIAEDAEVLLQTTPGAVANLGSSVEKRKRRASSTKKKGSKKRSSSRRRSARKTKGSRRSAVKAKKKTSKSSITVKKAAPGAKRGIVVTRVKASKNSALKAIKAAITAAKASAKKVVSKARAAATKAPTKKAGRKMVTAAKVAAKKIVKKATQNAFKMTVTDAPAGAKAGMKITKLKIPSGAKPKQGVTIKKAPAGAKQSFSLKKMTTAGKKMAVPKGPIKPGMVIVLRADGSNGKFCSAYQCGSQNAGAMEKMLVVDAGGGYFALRAGDHTCAGGKTCSAKHVASAEGKGKASRLTIAVVAPGKLTIKLKGGGFCRHTSKLKTKFACDAPAVSAATQFSYKLAKGGKEEEVAKEVALGEGREAGDWLVGENADY